MRISYIFGLAALVALGKLLVEKRQRRECELCGADMGFFLDGIPCDRCGKRVCRRCLRFGSHCDKCFEDIDARVMSSTDDEILGHSVVSTKGSVTTNRFATSERALFELKVQAEEKGGNALLRLKFQYGEEGEEEGEGDGAVDHPLIATADAVLVERKDMD